MTGVAAGMRLHHLGGPVRVLKVDGHEARVVTDGGAIFWTWDTCLWRSP